MAYETLWARGPDSSAIRRAATAIGGSALFGDDPPAGIAGPGCEIGPIGPETANVAEQVGPEPVCEFESTASKQNPPESPAPVVTMTQ